ncbi:MAG TPA: SGNH/GDSL hydrolase family protein [Planctomycetota bacterium]
MILALSLLLFPQNDKTQANSRDDAWESAWVTHSRAVYTTTGKIAGKVLHIGDSITYSNPYGQWPRNGLGRTAEDDAIRIWCHADDGNPPSLSATDPNGFYLAAVDVPSSNRSLTAASGITAGEYLSGSGQSGTAMPSTTDTPTAQGYVASSSYGGNLHITTVAAAFADAQFAVVMLGTNDFGRPVADFSNDLTAVVNALEGRNIVVILSTIPPRSGGDATPYNTAIRTLASTRGLPLIDYYEEILARRPGTTWQNTLISGDGIHPTAPNSSADPYAGGNAAIHQTGVNATNDGYLLRGWLTMQKLKEVKSYVADGVNPPSTPPPAPPAPPPAPPAVGSSGSDNDNGNGCGCGTATSPGLPWAALALLSLAWVARRK